MPRSHTSNSEHLGLISRGSSASETARVPPARPLSPRARAAFRAGAVRLRARHSVADGVGQRSPAANVARLGEQAVEVTPSDAGGLGSTRHVAIVAGEHVLDVAILEGLDELPTGLGQGEAKADDVLDRDDDAVGSRP